MWCRCQSNTEVKECTSGWASDLKFQPWTFVSFQFDLLAASLLKCSSCQCHGTISLIFSNYFRYFKLFQHKVLIGAAFPSMKDLNKNNMEGAPNLECFLNLRDKFSDHTFHSLFCFIISYCCFISKFWYHIFWSYFSICFSIQLSLTFVFYNFCLFSFTNLILNFQ